MSIFHHGYPTSQRAIDCGQAVVALVSLISLSFTLSVSANDPEAGEQIEKRWTGEAGLSYLATSGNTDTETLGLDFQLASTPEPWGVEFVAQLQRAEEDSLQTAERYYLSTRLKRSLSERWDFFLGLSGEQDEFAGLDLRTLVETGFVYTVPTKETHALSIDLGATWTDEDRVPSEPDSDHIGAILGLAYEWKISETATFSERLAIFPNFDDSDDWRFESTTALTASINARFAIQVAYELRFRNRPIGERDDTDATTKISLVMSL